MVTVNLCENWRMRRVGTEEFLPGSVPGSVYYDLLRNGRMEDPFYRDNELKALALMEEDYEYRTVFDEAEELFACEEVFLHFDGIDTVADVYLNDAWLGHTENMHRTWEFPVGSLLRKEGNELRVVLHSPAKFIRQANEKSPIIGSSDAMAGFPHLRKAHCMFGWDWGPRLPDAGIWREVKLLGVTDARIDGVYITQVHEKDRVSLRFQVDVDRLLVLSGVTRGRRLSSGI